MSDKRLCGKLSDGRKGYHYTLYGSKGFSVQSSGFKCPFPLSTAGISGNMVFESETMFRFSVE